MVKCKFPSLENVTAKALYAKKEVIKSWFREVGEDRGFV